MQPEAFRDIAHVGSVELFTPALEETRAFFVDLMAMKEVHREGDSIYLHSWDDYEQYTVKITPRVQAIEAAGLGAGWSEAEYGLGPVYHWTDPDGHHLGLYYETERYVATEEHRPSSKNQASAFPGRGANVRRLDHVNSLAADVQA